MMLEPYFLVRLRANKIADYFQRKEKDFNVSNLFPTLITINACVNQERCQKAIIILHYKGFH